MFVSFRKEGNRIKIMLATLVTVGVFPLIATATIDCSRHSYDRCVRIADPLIKEPHLVFPDNMEDINLVCRTWDRFVNCLKQYIDHCFTLQQRQQFNKAVENPIESIHKMCMSPNYQQEYLQYAPCIKNTITQRIHCGTHYNLLVDQVSQGDIISKSTLCCSHDRFKQCVSRETRRLCDQGLANGPAARFSNQIIDKALSFLQDQCYNYIPNSGDCTSLTTNTQLYIDPLTSSEVYPWSTIQDFHPQSKDIPLRITPPKMAATGTTPTTWLPSSSQPSSTQMLGTRTRPGSYGRSYSWSNPPSSSSSTMATTINEVHQPTTQSTINDWSTISSWQPKILESTYSTTVKQENNDNNQRTTWYPAAGDQLINEVDEPNQQGLTNLKNRSNHTNLSISLMILAITYLIV